MRIMKNGRQAVIEGAIVASPEMRAFLDYLCGEKASSEITRDIDARVAKVKRDGAVEEEYMYVARPLRDAYKQGQTEGRELGREEGRDNIIRMNEYLIENKRYEDLERATKDPDFRDTVLKEIGVFND